nr:hypothetical protein [Tanacetum cinerariifolium]
MGGIHGIDGGIRSSRAGKSTHSPWNCIVQLVSKLQAKGIDLLALCARSVGDGHSISFWEESRRSPRGGDESNQLDELLEAIRNVTFSVSVDGRKWELDMFGFTVSSNVDHLFFSCGMAQDLWGLLARWCALDIPEVSNIVEWFSWFDASHVSKHDRTILEGIASTTLWSIWNFCNAWIFLITKPKKANIWDSIVHQSLLWISSRNLKRVEKKREYNKQHYAHQKANRLKQIASGEGNIQHVRAVTNTNRLKEIASGKGSSQHTMADINVTPQVTTRLDIKTPERVPLGILEDRRVDCSSSPMNNSEVIDMTAGDSHTLTTRGDSVLANKENIPHCQNALLHSLCSEKPLETSQNGIGDVSQADLDKQKEHVGKKREYNKQHYARQKANRHKQISSSEGSSQYATTDINVTPRVTTRMDINYYQRSKEKNRVLMCNYQSGQTSTNTTTAIHVPDHTSAGATHRSSRLTFENNNEGCTDGNVNPSIIGDNQDVDPYDFIYHDVLKQHRVLKEQPPCAECGEKQIKFEFLTFCCMNGKTKLVSSNIPEELFNLFMSQCELGQVFMHKIRACSTNFSFTFMGVNLDTSMTKMAFGVHTFHAHGGIYHRIDQLVPKDGQPRYLELYFYDPEIELSHRLVWTNLDRQIIEILTRVLKTNLYMATFRSLADLGPLDNDRVKLNTSVELNQRNTTFQLHMRDGESIDEIIEDEENIDEDSEEPNETGGRKTVTMREYYYYKFQIRSTTNLLLLDSSNELCCLHRSLEDPGTCDDDF